jgi:hypothetical protein
MALQCTIDDKVIKYTLNTSNDTLLLLVRRTSPNAEPLLVEVNTDSLLNKLDQMSSRLDGMEIRMAVIELSSYEMRKLLQNHYAPIVNQIMVKDAQGFLQPLHG